MKSMYKAWALAGLLGLWAGAGLAEQGAAAGKSWSQLTPQQRELLQKAQEERWNSMTSEEQQHMFTGIERWQKMSPEERQRIRAERRKFRSLPEGERERLRRQHREAFEKLSPEKQQAIRDCKRRRQAGEDVNCRSLLPKPSGNAVEPSRD